MREGCASNAIGAYNDRSNAVIINQSALIGCELASRAVNDDRKEDKPFESTKLKPGGYFP